MRIVFSGNRPLAGILGYETGERPLGGDSATGERSAAAISVRRRSEVLVLIGARTGF